MKSPKDYLLLVLVLTTIGSAVLAWRQYNELIDLRAAAISNTERADWQKRIWDAEKKRKALEEKLAALDHHDTPEAGEAAPAAERTGRRNNRGPDRGGEFMALMDKPEMQHLLAVERKGALDARYASLFKNLNLTPEQLDKFKNLLVEKQTSMMDVLAAARAQGINPRTDPDAFKQMVGDAQGEIDASIKASLGDAGYAQYQNYEQTQPQRNTVSQLDQRLSYSGTPLTSAQSDQMVALLTANAPPATGNGDNLRAVFGGGGPMGGNNGTKITDATVSQAQGILTAPQLTALQQLQQEQQAQAQMAKAMRDLGKSTQGGGTTAAPAKTGGG